MSAEWESGMVGFDAEARGMMTLYVITQIAADAIHADAQDGDERAQTLMEAMIQSMDRIEAAPWDDTVLCFTCCRPVRDTTAIAFCIVVPGVASPEHVVGAVACTRCARKPNLLDQAVATLRCVWPDMRPVSTQVGRA
jgi:hypothetical protein